MEEMEDDRVDYATAPISDAAGSDYLSTCTISEYAFKPQLYVGIQCLLCEHAEHNIYLF
jgi:hypothetical protein